MDTLTHLMISVLLEDSLLLLHVVVVVVTAVAVAVFVELAGTSDAHITWENAKMHHRLDTIKMLFFVKLF